MGGKHTCKYSGMFQGKLVFPECPGRSSQCLGTQWFYEFSFSDGKLSEGKKKRTFKGTSFFLKASKSEWNPFVQTESVSASFCFRSLHGACVTADLKLNSNTTRPCVCGVGSLVCLSLCLICCCCCCCHSDAWSISSSCKQNFPESHFLKCLC